MGEGRTLASQEIRREIQEGRIVVPEGADFEPRIQPSSFEPTVGDEVFVLDPETHKVFRPNKGQTVYRSLLELPARRRQRVDISQGIEMKVGFSYLVPLVERLKNPDMRFAISSPKSSLGRVFLNDRMLADHNQGLNEVISSSNGDELMLWLLLEPLAFNLVLYPGLTLNQIKFFAGDDARLTPMEIAEEWKINPMQSVREGDKDVSIDPILTHGLRIHLDLKGLYTNGIVGLRARRNPHPIDLRKVREYNAEDYFEPLKATDGVLRIRGREHFLLSSREVLRFPPHLSAQLRAHSDIGFIGPMHQAGFIDNGFLGDLVYEPRPDETSDVTLIDGMPISELDVYRSNVPDKVYGEEIGSHYQGQMGPKVAKYFGDFDYPRAAREHKKLDKIVLVHDERVLLRHRALRNDGFEFMSDGRREALLADVRKGFWHSRYDCEKDERVLQPIPYVVIVGDNNTVFAYVRASDIKDYGDVRLFGKHSIGVGGHIVKADGTNIVGALEREVNEEVEFSGDRSSPELIGTMFAREKPVDRVHFGLVYRIRTTGGVRVREKALDNGRMLPIGQIMDDPLLNQRYETWSRLLIPHLPGIMGR